jgi:hypothetical protein
MTVNQKMAYHTTKSQSLERFAIGVVVGADSRRTTDFPAAGSDLGDTISPFAPDCARCLVTCVGQRGEGEREGARA